MKNHQLHALVAVAEQGSIRRAAQSLSLSQTALTKALRELELDLQAPLLQRSPQGARLTPVGLALLQHAKLILAEMEDARATVRHLLGLATPAVRVAVTPAFSLLCLSETVARFRQRYPDAPLSIRDAFLSQTLPMLRDGTIDLAITALMQGALGSDLAFESIAELRIGLAGSPPGVTRGVSVSQLAGAAPWLLDSSPWGISEAVRQWLALHGAAAPAQVIECPSSMASLVLSMQGHAIVPTPEAMFSVPWISSVTQVIAVREPLPSLPLGLVMRKGHRLDAPAEWFAECARLEMRRIFQNGQSNGSSASGGN